MSPSAPDPGLTPEKALAYFAQSDAATKAFIQDEMKHQRRLRWNDRIYEWAALASGLIVALAFGGAGFYCVLHGHAKAGVAISAADITGLVWAVKARPS